MKNKTSEMYDVIVDFLFTLSENAEPDCEHYKITNEDIKPLYDILNKFAEEYS